MAKIASAGLQKTPLSRSSLISRRPRSLVIGAIVLTILCLVSYSTFRGKLPQFYSRLSSAFYSLPNSFDVLSSNKDIRYQNPGWIRPCKAPKPNYWSGLTPNEEKSVLQTFELKKKDVELGNGAKVLVLKYDISSLLTIS
jgi:hypothetical protein